MDASLRSKAEQLAGEIAGQARTAEDLNGLMRLMMKSALERMLDTEMDVHLGRKALSVEAEGVPAEAPTATEPSPATSLETKPRPLDLKQKIGRGFSCSPGSEGVGLA